MRKFLQFYFDFFKGAGGVCLCQRRALHRAKPVARAVDNALRQLPVTKGYPVRGERLRRRLAQYGGVQRFHAQEHVQKRRRPPDDLIRRRRAARSKRAAAWGNDPEAVWALHNVDLTVHEGEFLGIAAPDQETGRLVTRKLFKLL